MQSERSRARERERSVETNEISFFNQFRVTNLACFDWIIELCHNIVLIPFKPWLTSSPFMQWSPLTGEWRRSRNEIKCECWPSENDCRNHRNFSFHFCQTSKMLHISLLNCALNCPDHPWDDGDILNSFAIALCVRLRSILESLPSGGKFSLLTAI